MGYDTSPWDMILGIAMGQPWEMFVLWIRSGKHTNITMGKVTMLLMGKSTISTGPFSSSQTLSHNQRISILFGHHLSHVTFSGIIHGYKNRVFVGRLGESRHVRIFR